MPVALSSDVINWPAAGSFDWKNPDYCLVLNERWDRLRYLRGKRHKSELHAVRSYYATHPVQFIMDWGITADQRRVRTGGLVTMPFVLFPKQVEWCAWFLSCLHDGADGITEKSRDCGVSWLLAEMFATLALFYPGFSAGFGSAKEDKIDRTGDPDTLFWKIRTFLEAVPEEFRGGWENRPGCSAHMRINIPESGGSITGEAGDRIGAGGRKSVYGIDEAAHIPHAEAIDSALLSVTDCRIDVSSVKGLANSFAIRRHSGKVRVFTFSYLDDPRKGKEWLDEMLRKHSRVALEQEVFMNYRASVEGQIIPAEHIDAATGAFEKLGIAPTGPLRAALDVADEGIDSNAWGYRHGAQVEHLTQWSGQRSDTFQTAVRAASLCEEYGAYDMVYDADGLGAFVRGDANKLNQERREDGRPQFQAHPFHGSGGVDDPDGELVAERKNQDYFANLKAQSWWSLMVRFNNTYLRVVKGDNTIHDDDIISINPRLREMKLPDSEQSVLTQLTMELCQPTYKLSQLGKVMVEKAPKLPDGRSTRSPNLADCVMMMFSPLGETELWSRL